MNDIDLPAVKSTKKANVPVIPLVPLKKTDKLAKTYAHLVGKDVVKLYRDAMVEKDRVDNLILDYKPYLEQVGLAEFFAINDGFTAEASRVNSVRLCSGQEPDRTKSVMITVSKAYSGLDEATVKATLEKTTLTTGEPAQVSDYVQWEPSAAFDTSVFKDANGQFSKEICQAYVDALEAVSLKFGKPNPLSLSKKLVVAPDFHTRRSVDFSPETNVALQTAFPAKITVKL